MTPEQERDRIDGWNKAVDWFNSYTPTLGRLQQECLLLYKWVDISDSWFARGGVDACMCYIETGVPPSPILEVVGNYEPCRQKAFSLTR